MVPSAGATPKPPPVAGCLHTDEDRVHTGLPHGVDRVRRRVGDRTVIAHAHDSVACGADRRERLARPQSVSGPSRKVRRSWSATSMKAALHAPAELVDLLGEVIAGPRARYGRSPIGHVDVVYAIPRAHRRRSPGRSADRLSASYASGSSEGLRTRARRGSRQRRQSGVGPGVGGHDEATVGARYHQRNIAVAHVGDELQVGDNVVEMRPLGPIRAGGWTLGCHMRSIRTTSAIICRASHPCPGGGNRQYSAGLKNRFWEREPRVRSPPRAPSPPDTCPQCRTVPADPLTPRIPLGKELLW